MLSKYWNGTYQSFRLSSRNVFFSSKWLSVITNCRIATLTCWQWKNRPNELDHVLQKIDLAWEFAQHSSYGPHIIPIEERFKKSKLCCTFEALHLLCNWKTCELQLQMHSKQCEKWIIAEKCKRLFQVKRASWILSDGLQCDHFSWNADDTFWMHINGSSQI